MSKKERIPKYKRGGDAGTATRNATVPYHTHPYSDSMALGRTIGTSDKLAARTIGDLGDGDTLRAAIIQLFAKTLEALGAGTIAKALHCVTRLRLDHVSTNVDLAGVHGELQLLGDAELYNSTAGDAAGVVGTLNCATTAKVEGAAAVLAETTVSDGSLCTVSGMRVMAPVLTANKVSNYHGLYIDGPATNATHDYSIWTEAGHVYLNSTGAADADVSINGDTNRLVFVDAGNETVALGDTAGSDYTTVESDGTLKFTGAATVWDDLQVNINNVKLPSSGMPTWTAYKGGYVLTFSAAATETISFTAQIPHRYREGSDIEFHLHCVFPDSNAGNVVWYFTHSWANIGDDFPNATPVTAVIASPANADNHQMDQVAAAISGTDKEISSVLLCSLSRIGGNVLDTYANDVYLTALDFHYEIDTVGSRTISSK